MSTDNNKYGLFSKLGKTDNFEKFKIRAGVTQPLVLSNNKLDASPTTGLSNLDDSSIMFTPTDYGVTSKQLEKDRELGITFSPYNTEKELDLARYNAQNWGEQFGNFLMQLGAGEIVLGTIGGFANIYQGIANTFTGEYGDNIVSKWARDLQNDIRDNFEIYRKNPHAEIALNDWGWWFNNAVSVGSTLSLLLPAAGWAKGLSYLGKISPVSKYANKLARGTSKIIAKQATKAGDVTRINYLRKIGSKANRIEQKINDYSNLIKYTTLSRLGESNIEASQVYDTVIEDVTNSLNELLANDAKNGTNEFEKFIELHGDEFKTKEGLPKSIEEISEQIATKAATKTFQADNWMILMDFIQFRALGKLLGVMKTPRVTSRQRIALENTKKRLAGKSDDELIKDNWINRQRENLKDIYRRPLDSFAFLNINEGFEEMYQGIQSEKGFEVANRYFDPDLTSRSISSYLTDPEIWNQAIWGSLGAIVFQGAAKGYYSAGRAIDRYKKKKTMSAEEYQQYLKSENDIMAEQINNTVNNANEFIDKIQLIQQGKNPYSTKKDVSTGLEIVTDQGVEFEDITEEEKDKLFDKAIREHFVNTAFNHIDAGTYDLMKEIYNSKEFDEYFRKNGITVTVDEKAVQDKVIEYMEAAKDLYETTIKNVHDSADSTNPFTEKVVARKIVRDKLQLEQLEKERDELYNIINVMLNNGTIDQTIATNYMHYNAALYNLNKYKSVKKQIDELNSKYQKGEISKAAYNVKLKELNELESEYSYSFGIYYKNLYLNNTDFDKDIDDIEHLSGRYILENINNIETKLNNIVKELPPSEFIKAVDNLTDTTSKTNILKSSIPNTQESIAKMYAEFARSRDIIIRNRIENALDTIKNYIEKQEDLDTIKQLLNRGEVKNKEVQEAYDLLRYGYEVNGELDQIIHQQSLNASIDAIFKEEIDKRNNAKIAIENAENDGNPIPITTDEQQTSDDNGQPSTGEDTNGTIDDKTTNDEIIDNANNNQDDNQNDITNNQVNNSNNDNNSFNENIENIDDSLNPNQIENARQDGTAYICKLAFTQQDKVKNIASEIANGNKEAENKLRKEVEDFLVKQGYNASVAKISTNEAFNTIKYIYKTSDKKNALYKLGEQLVIGFSENSASQYSITELINGSGIKEVLEEFLKEFVELHGIPNINGKYIINLNDLFYYLLNDEQFDKLTAARIYNRIFEYLSKNSEETFIFTGYPVRNNYHYSAEEFFDRLEESKPDINKMHIYPVEYSLRDDDYNEALLAAANGAKVIAKNEGNNISIVVEFKKGRKTKEVKLGILRKVNYDKDGNNIIPYIHNTGFRNIIKKINDKWVLDSHDFFIGLINKNNKDFTELYNIISNYGFNLYKILKNRANNLIKNNIEFKKLVDDILSDEVVEEVFNNKEFLKLLNDGIYKLKNYENLDANEKEKRKLQISNFIQTVGGIIFRHDPLADFNGNIDYDFVIGQSREISNFTQWEYNVASNYLETYEIQKKLKDNPDNISIKVDVPVHIQVNKSDTPINISDLPIDADKTSREYTPLVYINKDSHIITQTGEDLGIAPIGMRPNSMGYLIYNKNGNKRYLWLQNSINLNNSEEDIHKEFIKQIRIHFLSILGLQKSNINNSNEDHNKAFSNIITRINDLIGFSKLFHFQDVEVRTNNDGTCINITKTKNGKELFKLSIWKVARTKDNNRLYNSNNVILNINGKSYNVTNAINNASDKYYSILNDTIKELLDDVRINRSFDIFNLNEENAFVNNNSVCGYKTNENRKSYFEIKLGDKTYKYNNYSEFIASTKGFTTDVVSSNGQKDGMINITSNLNKFSIRVFTKDSISDNDKQNTNVTDLLYDDKKQAKRKTVDTEDLLKAAGVEEEKIDILLGKTDGVPQIVNKRIYVSEQPNSDERVEFYNKKDGTEKGIHITPKGASVLNGQPVNAIRLVLHENIHRLFSGKTYTDKERSRIIKELREVYEYTIQKLEEDYRSGRFAEIIHNISSQSNADNIYRAIISVLSKTQSYETERSKMEEFLVECLTQPFLSVYLNETQYSNPDDATISNINVKKKTLFQKIIDIIFDLFNLNGIKVKDKSILAREYRILSKGNLSTVAQGELFDQRQPDKPKNDTDNSNKILNNTVNKVNAIESEFGRRVTRSENFEEDHTYFIDGKPADYSVTQKIHGKQNLGQYGIVASRFGNTADEYTRSYFENDGIFPNEESTPNVTTEELHQLKLSCEEIKKHLDKKFGKDKYKVITREFPIAGTIKVNEEIKTIAGTMDMLVCTDKGDIFIYDFKTRRGGIINEETLIGYKEQLNIYRQILESNFPDLKGKIHIGGIIKFIVNYPTPKGNVKYRENPNNKKQIQITTDGTNYIDIQDSNVDYNAPFISSLDNNAFIEIEEKNYKDEIDALPDIENNKGIDSNDRIGQDEEDVSFLNDSFDPVDFAITELIDDNNASIAEIYNNGISRPIVDNPHGIKIATSMEDFIASFPSQFEDDIKQLIANNEVNYVCE